MSEKLTGGLKGNFSRFLPDSGLVLEGGNISGTNLFDLQVNGTSRFRVDKTGIVNIGNGCAIITPNISGGTSFQYLDNGIKFANAIGNYYHGFQNSIFGLMQNGAVGAAQPYSYDVLMRAAGAAKLALGSFDAAAPVAQTLSVQSVVAGTTDTAGVDFTITGSQGTGTGAGGNIVFKGSPAASTGNTQNALIQTFAIKSISSTSSLLYGPTGAATYLQLGNDVALENGNSGRPIDLRAGGGSGPVNITGPTTYLAWSTTNNNTSPDLRLYRDAANTLALRNGINAQTFNLYGTYTDGSNYERLSLLYTASNDYVIAADKLGTGSYRSLTFITYGNATTTFESDTIKLMSNGRFAWTNTSSSRGSADLFLTRKAAASLQLGAADAAAPVAQTLSVQSVVAGTTNVAGVNLTITGSQGTGTGAGGSIIFQVAPAGSTGSTQNALATALTIASDKSAAFSGTVKTNTIISNSDFYLQMQQGAGIQHAGFWASGTAGALGGVNGAGFALGANYEFGWSGTNYDPVNVVDLKLARDASNTLAQRRGVNAQTFRLYNTYIDTSNYERGVFDWATTANVLRIGTEAAGTGTLRSIALVGGNVGIGTTNPFVFAKLTIAESIAGTNVRSIINHSDSTNGASHSIMQITTGGASGGDPHIYFGISGVGSSGWTLGLDNSDSDKFKISGPYGDVGGLGTNDRFTIDASGNVGIGTSTPGYKLEVNGSFAATTKSFVIDHPTKPDMKLRYGSLEGPENGVYIRGKSTSDIIELPEYWTNLVHEDSITVSLTAIGDSEIPRVSAVVDNKVYVKGRIGMLNYFYHIFAERKDVDKLLVEF